MAIAGCVVVALFGCGVPVWMCCALRTRKEVFQMGVQQMGRTQSGRPRRSSSIAGSVLELGAESDASDEYDDKPESRHSQPGDEVGREEDWYNAPLLPVVGDTNGGNNSFAAITSGTANRCCILLLFAHTADFDVFPCMHVRCLPQLPLCLFASSMPLLCNMPAPGGCCSLSCAALRLSCSSWACVTGCGALGSSWPSTSP